MGLHAKEGINDDQTQIVNSNTINLKEIQYLFVPFYVLLSTSGCLKTEHITNDYKQIFYFIY